MANPLISGVQQVGIGVKDVSEAWAWYRKVLGFDVPLFDDSAQAKLMIPYTAGEVRSRRALMALNLSGGGGLEIWQFTDRVPQPCSFEPVPGDLGIYAIRFKAKDIGKAHAWISERSKEWVGAIHQLPDGRAFWIADLYGNKIQIAEDTSWFKERGQATGGVAGVVIGVSDMDKALSFYQSLVSPSEIVYDKTGVFEDLPADAGQQYRRVLLRKNASDYGAFSQLLGHLHVELIQALEKTPRKVFENRLWGDLGYIHACFDTLDMPTLKTKMEGLGYPFTVDSEDSFGMESAAGRFAYVEDPDGTLIELVETHKLPILKKIGWYLDIRKRKHQKPLPKWMLGMMGLSRVKD